MIRMLLSRKIAVLEGSQLVRERDQKGKIMTLILWRVACKKQSRVNSETEERL
jgi:hypothetical protein